MAPRILLVALASASLVAGGCNIFGPKKPVDNIPVSRSKIKEREASEFVDFLNRQSNALQTVRYEDVALSVKMPGQWVPRLPRGLIVCGKPNSVRMTAAAAIGPNQLDVGSNDREMWMYVKMAETPFVYCSHADFGKVQATLPVKFEPDWVLQALGMSNYDERKEYSLRVNERDRTYWLGYPETTSAGDEVYKITEIAADEAFGTRPQIKGHRVYAKDRKTLIAEAKIVKVAEQTVGSDQRTGGPIVVQVPTEVSLEWPRENVRMELSLGGITVNERMTSRQHEELFERPKTLGNASPINLAEYATPARR